MEKLAIFRLGISALLLTSLGACGGGSEDLCGFSCDGDTRMIRGENACYCAASDGAREGRYVAWYPNGSKWIEREYEGGKITGAIYTWTEEGDLFSIHSWSEEPEGLAAEFAIYRLDFRVLEGRYFNGLPEGRWILSDIEDGSTVVSTVYDNGHHCGDEHRCWDPVTEEEIVCEEILEDEGCARDGDKVRCPACGARGDFNSDLQSKYAALDDDDTQIYQVVRSPVDLQFNIVPVGRRIPPGWLPVPCRGTKRECLKWITENWVDLRPYWLRQLMG